MALLSKFSCEFEVIQEPYDLEHYKVENKNAYEQGPLGGVFKFQHAVDITVFLRSRIIDQPTDVKDSIGKSWRNVA